MQKLQASLPNIFLAAFNAVMCWGINQLWSKSDLNIDTNIFLGIVIGAVILIGFLSSQSTSSSAAAESNNIPWVVGLLPMSGSMVLFGLLKSSYLPTNLIQYVGLACLFLFVTGTILPVLIVCLNIWRGNKSTTSAKVEKDARQVLLRAMTTEVAIRLQDNLHYETWIELLKEHQPELVHRAEQLKPLKPLKSKKTKPRFGLSSQSGATPTEVSEDEKVISIFKRIDVAGRLLILGEPGSGKTTTLLELAWELLQEAAQPGNQTIPFLFELSNWKDDDLSIGDWLAADLKSRYKIPEDETKNLLESGQLLPLLDGLDELGLTRQVQCITKVDQYLQTNPSLQVTVCCRLQEYQAGRASFEKLRWAICIHPLTPKQIENYLLELERTDLWQSIQNDPNGLLKLAELPLFLHLIPVAYPKGYLQPNLGRQQNSQQYLEKRRHQLFAAYIKRQLEKPDNRYSAKNTKKWLQWLAWQLRERNQTEFLLETMQPDLIESPKYRLLYFLITGLITGVVIGLAVGFMFRLIGGLIMGTIAGLIAGIIIAFVISIMLIGEKIKPVETINLNFNRIFVFLILGLIGGLIIALIISLIILLIGESISSLIWSLISGLIIGLITALIAGIHGDEIRIKNKPNQGIIESAKNAVILISLIFPLTTLLLWLHNPINNVINVPVWSFALTNGFCLALIIGIFSGGGLAVIQHYTLRFVLWCSGNTPLNYVDFLSYTTECRMIQRVGGRYRFIHDLLREYLAGVQPWRCTCTLRDHADIVFDIALSRDSKTMVSASFDNTIKLWRLSADGQASLLRTYKEHTAPVTCVTFTPDSQTLVSGSSDKTLKIWDINTEKCDTLKEHSSPVWCLAITSNSTHLASGSRDGVVNIWHLPTRQLIKSISAHSLEVNCLAFTPDGRVLVSGSTDRRIKVWETATGKLLNTFPSNLFRWIQWLIGRFWYPSTVYTVAITSDGKTLVSSSAREAVEVWHLNTGKRHRTLSVHLKRQWRVGISPDWQIIAGIGENGAIRLHHFSTGKLIGVLYEHSADVNSIVFSQDGRFFVSGSADKTIKIWQPVDLASQASE